MYETFTSAVLQGQIFVFYILLNLVPILYSLVRTGICQGITSSLPLLCQHLGCQTLALLLLPLPCSPSSSLSIFSCQLLASVSADVLGGRGEDFTSKLTYDQRDSGEVGFEPGCHCYSVRWAEFVLVLHHWRPSQSAHN